SRRWPRRGSSSRRRRTAADRSASVSAAATDGPAAPAVTGQSPDRHHRVTADGWNTPRGGPCSALDGTRVGCPSLPLLIPALHLRAPAGPFFLGSSPNSGAMVSRPWVAPL